MIAALAIAVSATFPAMLTCKLKALALFAACQNDEKVGACVDFYGIHPNVEYNWDNLKAPVLGIWAEEDDGVNPQLEGFAKGTEKTKYTKGQKAIDEAEALGERADEYVPYKDMDPTDFYED